MQSSELHADLQSDLNPDLHPGCSAAASEAARGAGGALAEPRIFPDFPAPPVAPIRPDPLLRLFDLAVGLVGLAVAALLLPVIALAIKLEGKTAIFYHQNRPGLRGRPFRLYKFTTMVADGDEILRRYLNENPAARRQWRKYRKLKGFDPRVTRVGRILRRFSLDELPQFLNVVRGDMSVVGPRPYLALEFVDYGLDPNVLDRILSVKPGLTGLWQTSRRNEAPFLERVEMDLRYIASRTLGGDLLLVLKTVPAMLLRRGAY